MTDNPSPFTRNEERFYRSISDFWDKCPYCNTRTLTRVPMEPAPEKLLFNTPSLNHDIKCTLCNKIMTHLEWRSYGINWMKRTHSNFPPMNYGITKYDSERHHPFKERTPLWAINTE